MISRALVMFLATLLFFSGFLAFANPGSADDLADSETAVEDESALMNQAESFRYGFFTENAGQWDSEVDYVGLTSYGAIGLSGNGIYMNFISEIHGDPEMDEMEEPIDENTIQNVPLTYSGNIVKISFVDSNILVPSGREEMRGKYNYLIGEESNWVTGVRNYESVIIEDVWDGIDVKYYFSDEGVKYDFIIGENADPSDIVMKVEGQESISVIDGQLNIKVRDGVAISDTNLDIFYADNSKEKIYGSIKLTGENTYTFDLAPYDSSRSVVIDPLYYSSYLGGYGYDYGYGISATSDNEAVASGYTSYSSSGEFPTTTGAYQSSRAGTSYDAYVTKFNYAGNELIYSTFLGGGGSEYSYADNEVDSSGNVYIAGYTYYYSSDMYPTTSGAYQRSFTYSNYPEIFVTKLNSAGSSLIYSTYIGGAYYDYVRDLAIDSSGSAYITGYTSYHSTYSSIYGDYPTTSGAYQTTRTSTSYTVFVTKFNTAGSGLSYSTFIGGYSSDYGYEIAVDTSGNAFITGYTYYSTSGIWPTTSGAYQTSFTYSNYPEVFVTKFNAAGSSLTYSTLLGGAYYDYGYGIDVDSNGHAIVTGYSGYSSTYNPTYGEFPTTSGAYQTTRSGGYEVFVTKFNYGGTALDYSTFVGGSGSDYARYHAIEIGSNDNAYVIGTTYSSDFPTVNAYDSSYSSTDGFLFNLTSNGSTLSYSTYIGGTGTDNVYAVGLDKYDIAYLNGYTYSSDFPTTTGAYDTSYDSGADCFVFKYGTTRADDKKPVITADRSDTAAYTGQDFDFEVAVTDEMGLTGVFVEYWFGTGSHTNESITLIEPYTHTITIPNSIDTFYYFFSATDYHGNWASTSQKSMTPIDSTGPSFSVITASPNPPTTGGTCTFTCDVWDNVAYVASSVVLHYGGDNSAWSSAGMTNTAGDTFSATVSVSVNWARVYLYFTASDTSSNVGTSGVYYVNVNDNINPTFVSDNTPTSATTGDAFTFSITMNDNVGIGTAKVTYWYGLGSTTDLTLAISGAGAGSDQTGTATITIPSTSTTTLYYYYDFADTDGNPWLFGPSSTVSVPVNDNDAPTVTSVRTDSATTGDSYYFSIGIDDNIDGTAVDEAHVLWTYADDWDNADNVSLTYDSVGLVWNSAVFTVNLYSLDPINYNITAKDAAGNWMTSTGYTTIVEDNDPPEIEADNTPTTATTGDQFEFNVSVSDNIGVDYVLLNYEYQNGGTVHSMMYMNYEGNGYYSLVQDAEHTMESIEYNFEIYDTSGNSFTMDNDTITMQDNDDPEFYSDMSAETANAGDEYLFKIFAIDNIGIDDDTVKVVYWFDYDGTEQEAVMTYVSGEIYRFFYHSIMLQSKAGILYYKFQCQDVNGRPFETSEKMVDILDSVSPVISDPVYDAVATTGDDYVISVEVTDDVELKWVRLYYFIGEEPAEVPYIEGSTRGDYEFSIAIPDEMTMLTFWVEASDMQGNMASTAPVTVYTVDDDAPVFVGDDMSSTEASTGDYFVFAVNAADNIGIMETAVHYMLPDGTNTTEAMTHNGEYYMLNITLSNNYMGPMFYQFTVKDHSMNSIMSDMVEIDVVDDELPVADIRMLEEAYQHDTVTFDGERSSDNVGLDNWTWAIAGMVLYGPVVSYLFDDVGDYPIVLTVTDLSGQSVFIERSLRIRDADNPVAMADVPSELGNHEVLIGNASASYDNVGIAAYGWILILPDNTKVIQTGHLFEYDLAGLLGNLTLTLTVMDDEGNSDKAIFYVNVIDTIPPVVIAPDDIEIYVGTLMRFTDELSSDNVGIIGWEWIISWTGGTLNYTGKSFAHYFDMIGIYNITLNIMDSYDNTGSDSFLVTVSEVPDDLDSDGDGMPDVYEDEVGLNKNEPDADRDTDGDKIINKVEYQIGTNPLDIDTDGDGMPDDYEYKYAYDPDKTNIVVRNGRSAPQWMWDFEADIDTDGDGDTNIEEYKEGNKRNPTVEDSEESDTDYSLLYIILAVVIILIILIIMVIMIKASTSVRPVKDEFPEGEYPHLYKKEEKVAEPLNPNQ
ncbi:MAG: SBBP repeat-containing protein [Thermoplasmatota archaeon]